MKLIYLTTMTALAVMLAAPAIGQVMNPAKVKFNGVGLDSTYSQVVKALGKPATEEKAKPEECIGGHEKSVTYPGLSIYFMDGDSRSGTTFEVKSFEITTARWIVSGAKVGDTEALVRRKFGRKYMVDSDPETGDKVWQYEMSDRDGPGKTSVSFRNGKVVSIASSYQVC